MSFALVSSLTLLAGVTLTAPARSKAAGAQACREMVGGSLLAAGLMLLGVGLHSAGG